MRRQVHFEILYEGKRDRDFILSYLKQKGYDVSNVIPRRCAKELGVAGDKCVRSQFSAAVTYIRKYAAMNGPGNRWLIVHVDADTNTQEYRYDMLNNQLPQNDKLNSQDQVCILIPKRHTETWVYYILNSSEYVSETEIYKNIVTDIEVRSAGQQLALFDPTSNVNCPPSLKVGYTELCRLPG